MLVRRRRGSGEKKNTTTVLKIGSKDARHPQQVISRESFRFPGCLKPIPFAQKHHISKLPRVVQGPRRWEDEDVKSSEEDRLERLSSSQNSIRSVNFVKRGRDGLHHFSGNQCSTNQIHSIKYQSGLYGNGCGDCGEISCRGINRCEPENLVSFVQCGDAPGRQSSDRRAACSSSSNHLFPSRHMDEGAKGP